MNLKRQARAFGWLIAMVSAAAAIISLRGRRPPVVVSKHLLAMADDSAAHGSEADGVVRPPAGEVDIELATPSIWPAAAGLGVTLGFAGFVTSPFVGLAGVIVLVAALAGWIGEMVHEHNG